MHSDNEKEYTLYDIESGTPYKVSKDHYDRYMKMINDLRCLISGGEKFGKIFITGTGGGEDNSNLEDMFRNLENYKTVDWNPDTQWNERYIIGVDPYYTDDSGNSKCEIFKKDEDDK